MFGRGRAGFLGGLYSGIGYGILPVMERVVANEVRGDVDAHDHAMSEDLADVVRELVDLLGKTTVAVIGGVGETRAVAQWMTGREPQRPDVLRFALQIATMIATQADRKLARAWFAGSNPMLQDQSPALMLRNRPLHEVQAPLVAAARAFAASR